jgi:hypothetical protein
MFQRWTKFLPRDLLFGEQKLDYNNVCKIPFGAYLQVHDDLDVTNTVESRSTGAINIGPSGNVQGTHNFLWKLLPVPLDVIDRLKELTTNKSECEHDFCEEQKEDTEKTDNTDKTVELIYEEVQ